ncbi:MAG: hypothetical protein R3C11_06995 [Planctomycetaceae bacterium]
MAEALVAERDSIVIATKGGYHWEEEDMPKMPVHKLWKRS